MSQRGGGGSQKSAKKCHVLFEWPLKARRGKEVVFDKKFGSAINRNETCCILVAGVCALIIMTPVKVY